MVVQLVQFAIHLLLLLAGDEDAMQVRLMLLSVGRRCSTRARDGRRSRRERTGWNALLLLLVAQDDFVDEIVVLELLLAHLHAARLVQPVEQRRVHVRQRGSSRAALLVANPTRVAPILVLRDSSRTGRGRVCGRNARRGTSAESSPTGVARVCSAGRSDCLMVELFASLSRPKLLVVSVSFVHQHVGVDQRRRLQSSLQHWHIVDRSAVTGKTQTSLAGRAVTHRRGWSARDSARPPLGLRPRTLLQGVSVVEQFGLSELPAGLTADWTDAGRRAGLVRSARPKTVPARESQR